ncbi:MAG: cation:proton antiporter [Candidatus Sigynarchaeota archaeon]
MNSDTLIFEIGIIIILAGGATVLARRLRIPGLIGAILIGLFLGGPGGVGLIVNVDLITIISILGAILLLFMTGLKFDLDSFFKMGRKAFLITTFGVVTSLFSGFVLGLLLGWSPFVSFLLGVMISPSGTSVLASILDQKRMEASETGSLIITAAVIDDVEGIILYSVAAGLIRSASVSWVDVTSVTVVSIVFVFGSIILGKKAFPRLVSALEKHLNPDVLFMILLGIGLIMAFTATMIGVAAITGAFLIGALIPTETVGKKMEERLALMKDVFVSLFFVSIGLMVSPVDMILFLPLSLLVLGVAIGGRLAGGAIGVRLSGMRLKEAFACVGSLAIRGELSLIMAREAIVHGIAGPEFLVIAFLVIVGSVLILVPLVFKKESKTMPAQEAREPMPR